MDACQAILRVCCVCRRVQVDERWVRQAEAPHATTLMTHTYCPACFHEALAHLHPPVTPPRPAALVLACG
jgi:hypothetical protein